ncbi:MAG: MucR family transcriptional regulator [Desulfovibrio sp.]|nr:MucR family transcriptional regulator [Desulfovibrio sp.]
MALEDKEIFRAVCEKFQDQPMEFIMAQYAKAKHMNMEIERLTHWDLKDSEEPEEAEVVTEAEVEEVEAAPRKKLTKRRLIMDPAASITDDAIYCCVCGAEFQSLTRKHLAKHDTTPEEYRKVCGFAPDTPLMSKKRFADSKKIIARAQEARLKKRDSEAAE